MGANLERIRIMARGQEKSQKLVHSNTNTKHSRNTANNLPEILQKQKIKAQNF